MANKLWWDRKQVSSIFTCTLGQPELIKCGNDNYSAAWCSFAYAFTCLYGVSAMCGVYSNAVHRANMHFTNYMCFEAR